MGDSDTGFGLGPGPALATGGIWGNITADLILSLCLSNT